MDSPLTQVRVLFLIIDTDVCIEPESAGGGHCCIKVVLKDLTQRSYKLLFFEALLAHFLDFRTCWYGYRFVRPLFGSGDTGRDIGTHRRGGLTNRDSFVGIGVSNQLLVSLDTVFCVRDFVLSGIAVYLRFWLFVNPKCCLPCCESDTY